ncbi:MAG: lytic transglycosylase domain-containing protein [Acidobacteriota bacterium]
MLKKFVTLLILIAAAPGVFAQQRPLSPPERSPVPLTSSDLEKARAEEAARKQPPAPAGNPGAMVIKIPAAVLGHHISSGNAAIDAMVYEAAARNGLDPCLILSVMRAESGFRGTAVSPKGASGLMQLMPATAARFGVRNIFDARENVLGGSLYLRWLLDRFNGDVRLALAGYNAGEGAVEFYGLRIPPFAETQNYVRTIYARYSNIHAGTQPTTMATQAPKPADLPAGQNPTYNQIIRSTSSSGDGKTGR